MASGFQKYICPNNGVSIPSIMGKKKLFFDCMKQHSGSQFPNQGSNPHLLQREHRLLTTGPPGKPIVSYFLSLSLSRFHSFFFCFFLSKPLPFYSSMQLVCPYFLFLSHFIMLSSLSFLVFFFSPNLNLSMTLFFVFLWLYVHGSALLSFYVWFFGFLFPCLCLISDSLYFISNLPSSIPSLSLWPCRSEGLSSVFCL